MTVIRGPEHPGYRHLNVTTKTIKRTSIFDLPLNLEVRCSWATGWQLVDQRSQEILAGEFAPEGLRLDVGYFVIVDTLSPAESPPAASGSAD